MTEISIDHRFRGPPASGNGGYSAGLVATALGGSDCVVTLHKPPPLDQALKLERDADEAVLLFDDAAVASAVRSAIEVDVPRPPAFQVAAAAEARFTGLCDHIFPGCFVCGPARAEGDGLRIFPGRIEPEQEGVSATWTPDPDFADGGGKCRSEILWAALDCPGYFAVQARAGKALLGRLGARLVRPAEAGEPLIVTGWPIASEGRRHLAGTALHDCDGNLVAAAVATWVTLKP